MSGGSNSGKKTPLLEITLAIIALVGVIGAAIINAISTNNATQLEASLELTNQAIYASNTAQANMTASFVPPTVVVTVSSQTAIPTERTTDTPESETPTLLSDSASTVPTLVLTCGTIVSPNSVETLVTEVYANASYSAPKRNGIRVGTHVRIVTSTTDSQNTLWYRLADYETSEQILGWIPHKVPDIYLTLDSCS